MNNEIIEGSVRQFKQRSSAGVKTYHVKLILKPETLFKLIVRNLQKAVRIGAVFIR